MKTLRVRIKDKYAAKLDRLACEVNFVWNYVNELSYTHTQRTGKFFSAFDLQKYTAGATERGLLHLNGTTVQEVSRVYATRRITAKKAKLRWRVSSGPRKSLGWVPFKVGAVKYCNGQLRYAKRNFGIWDSYGLSKYELRAGCFNQDARGRWYANICVEEKTKQSSGTKSVGIDLGLKNFAALSDGAKIEAQQFFRREEQRISNALRAHKRKRAKALHEKIANRRKDFLHKLSAKLVAEHGAIFIGNINAAKLGHTSKGKSVYDAGWSKFRTMLRYKCENAGVLLEEVDEAFSTQTCSVCAAHSGPKGIAGLGIREWVCSACGAKHDRDVNSAKVILARGHARLVEGNPQGADAKLCGYVFKQ